MRTVVLSDIHLGNERGYDIFAGAQALPSFLRSLVAQAPVRVVLNGDTVDFLMNEDPLELELERAVEQAHAIAAASGTAAVFEALGLLLAKGSQVEVRLGNHDIELALPQVQHVFREALRQPASVAERLVFVMGDAPGVLDVGGARILLAHGEQNDAWNQVEYPALLAEPQAGAYPAFRYPPGSKLVKTLLNPLKREFGMRFADLLKPDFQGGALTALAVDPGAVKLVFQGSTLSLAWQLLGRKRLGDVAFTFDEDPEAEVETPDLGLFERLAEAGLTPEELGDLEALDDDMPFAFDDDSALVRPSAALKMLRAGLKFYARTQRSLAGDQGQRYFDLEPEPAEWQEAKRLAAKYAADAVILGHTHSARFLHRADLCFVNTGTWIWLMSLPSHDATDAVWIDFLEQLRDNPQMDSEHGPCPPLVIRFTAAILDPHPEGGASVALVEWKPQGASLEILAECHVRPA